MMRSIKIIFLICINIVSFTLAGTDGTIRGRVTDEESMELPGATIYLPELGIGAAADPEGNFCLLYTSPSPRDRSLSRMPSSA